MAKGKLTFKYFAKNILIVISLVLIWRGIWYLLDGLDKLLFDGGNIFTAIGSIFVGLILLCIFDHDLKAIEKL